MRIVPFDRNHGYARGYNLAVEQARGAVLVLLNQDTVVHRRWLEELLRPFADERAVIAHPAVVTPWRAEFAVREREAPVPGDMMELSRLGYVRYRPQSGSRTSTLYAAGCSLAVRRSWIVERGRLFEESFHSYAEDMELALAARCQGRDVVYVPAAVVYHEHSLDSSWTPAAARKTVRIIRNRLLAFYLHSTTLELPALIPLTLIGAPGNSSEFGLTGWRRVVAGAALVPAAAIALPAFLVAAMSARGRRGANLRRRTRGRFWLAGEVLRRPF